MTLGWIYLVHSSGRRQTKKKKTVLCEVCRLNHSLRNRQQQRQPPGSPGVYGSPTDVEKSRLPVGWHVPPNCTHRHCECHWVISDGVFRIRPWIRLYLFEVNMHPMAPESRHQHGCNAIVRGFPHWWTKPPPTNSPVNHRSIRMFLPLFFCALWPDPPGTQTEALLSRRASKQPHPSGPQRGEHTAPQHPAGTQPHAQDPFPCSPHNPSHHPAGAPHPASRPSPQRAAPKWPPGGRAAAVAAP